MSRQRKMCKKIPAPAVSNFLPAATGSKEIFSRSYQTMHCHAVGRRSAANHTMLTARVLL